MPNGLLVSVEGISGSGKTYLISRLLSCFTTAAPLLIPELSTRDGDGLDARILGALRHKGDRFFRLGLPRTETFLLYALKVLDFESAIEPALREGRIVIGTASIDTIAVYQALMLAPGSPAQQAVFVPRLYDLAIQWRRPPDLTFLIWDTTERSIERAQHRNGRRYSDDEAAILRDAARLYELSIAGDPDRILRVNRNSL